MTCLSLHSSGRETKQSGSPCLHLHPPQHKWPWREGKIERQATVKYNDFLQCFVILSSHTYAFLCTQSHRLDARSKMMVVASVSFSTNSVAHKLALFLQTCE